MGWTVGRLDRPFSARAAIAFDLGQEFVDRVLATSVSGKVIYAAVRSADSSGVFALVLLTEREAGLLYTKPVSEDMGPVENGCPARILDLLTAPSNERARDWRRRCRIRLAHQMPRPGETVIFSTPIQFTNESEHQTLVFCGGSEFCDRNGSRYRLPGWRRLEFRVEV
jgi:hypothetical protein